MMKKVAVVALAAGAVLVPGYAANATTEITPQHSQAACELSDAQLDWGVRTSFRAYISGSIARGKWETLDGATYKTPLFSWQGTGEVADKIAQTKFKGGIHFTGHKGVLDIVMANPAVKIVDDKKALLIVDVKSNDMEGKVAIDEKQVEFADIDLNGTYAATDGDLKITNAPVKLTEKGAVAFAGFYKQGEPMDPVTMTAKSSAGCIKKALAGELKKEEKKPADAPADKNKAEKPAADAGKQESGAPIVPIAVGGAAVVAIGAVAFLLTRKRAK
ncbi:MAG: HtaA domain-containing protein [Microbacteriaceae bacterium]|nr:HtaA domain-containing protein [Microbacteriaceae bacterium]